jgi:phosphoenolpyruvate synthase/pyruvate phosphate dikinase
LFITHVDILLTWTLSHFIRTQVLNLGLNDVTAAAMEQSFGERFAMDSYRRFLHMFGTVVMDIPHHFFETAMHDLKEKVTSSFPFVLEGTTPSTLNLTDPSLCVPRWARRKTRTSPARTCVP